MIQDSYETSRENSETLCHVLLDNDMLGQVRLCLYNIINTELGLTKPLDFPPPPPPPPPPPQTKN